MALAAAGGRTVGPPVFPKSDRRHDTATTMSAGRATTAFSGCVKGRNPAATQEKARTKTRSRPNLTWRVVATTSIMMQTWLDRWHVKGSRNRDSVKVGELTEAR